MKKPLNLSLLFMISTAIFWTGGAAYSQQTLSVPVPLPPDQTAQPLSDTQPDTHSDPERWGKEDITLEEQLSTAKKETMAAYQIALDECKHLTEPQILTCQNQARQEMEAEMSRIRALFGLPN